MSSLMRRMFFRTGMKGKDQWLVVCEDMKTASLDKIPEVLDRNVHGEELSVKGTVACLGRLECLREVRDWMPMIVNVLPRLCLRHQS